MVTGDTQQLSCPIGELLQVCHLDEPGCNDGEDCGRAVEILATLLERCEGKERCNLSLAYVGEIKNMSCPGASPVKPVIECREVYFTEGRLPYFGCTHFLRHLFACMKITVFFIGWNVNFCYHCSLGFICGCSKCFMS